MKNELIKKIKQNKKYKSISDSVVKREIEDYFRSNPKAGFDKQTVKEVRKKLHRIYSSYQTGKKNKRDLYLKELKILVSDRSSDDVKFNDLIDKLLSVAISTKERLDDYEYVYGEIFRITGKPKVIVDLGAGLNPLSYPLMGLEKVDYYSYDIDEEDVKFLNEYYKIMNKNGLKGKAGVLDVRDLDEVDKVMKTVKSDVVFMFKLIDLIDDKKKVSEELIKVLMRRTKFIVASFATRTLGRKNMKLPRRRGFELMLDRIGLQWKSFSTSNEIFYVVNN